MKKLIPFMVIIGLISNVAFAQQKGDHLLGLNFSANKLNQSTYQYSGYYESTMKNSSIGFLYSNFLNDNRRLILGIGFSKEKYSSDGFNYSKINGFNAQVGVGLLYPILKKFYAEISPNLSYANLNEEEGDYRLNSINTELSGGLFWTPLKHFGIGLTLASIGFSYTKEKNITNYNPFFESNENNTSFNVTNSGNLQNQTFTVFYKF